MSVCLCHAHCTHPFTSRRMIVMIVETNKDKNIKVHWPFIGVLSSLSRPFALFFIKPHVLLLTWMCATRAYSICSRFLTNNGKNLPREIYVGRAYAHAQYIGLWPFRMLKFNFPSASFTLVFNSLFSSSVFDNLIKLKEKQITHSRSKTERKWTMMK